MRAVCCVSCVGLLSVVCLLLFIAVVVKRCASAVDGCRCSFFVVCCLMCVAR